MPDTQYFTNIDGKYVKDAEARQQLNDLEDYVESLDQPWQPLEDGYSNFWFELTNDTLSPWLNFSAKNADATIDWGDGSGEVALDTLTPTHTYSKAGKYVVKVKGVTGIAQQHVAPFDADYLNVLKHVELNNDVTIVGAYGLAYCYTLKNIALSNVSSIGTYAFAYNPSIRNINIDMVPIINTFAFNGCWNLTNITMANNVTQILRYAFSGCVVLNNVTIPSTVTTIDNYVFNGCNSLLTVHVQAISPPTLGTTPFINLPNDYIIYVPIGTGDTYKAASGWSTYADHILEEGETPTRAMVAKFNAMKTDEPQDDMR